MMNKKAKKEFMAFTLLTVVGLVTLGIGGYANKHFNYAVDTDASSVNTNELLANCPENLKSYYAGVSGTKWNLRNSLNSCLPNKHSGTYDGLWDAYLIADLTPEGYIKDIYSNTTRFTSKHQGLSYKKEGDGYNREHSTPKSWWGSSNQKTNQGADPYIVFPSDGYVNNKRSNFAFGEVDPNRIDYSSNNGYCKLGESIHGQGTVFEPADEVKGDMARSAFYAITCYDTSSWTHGDGSKIYSKNGTCGLTPYALDLYLRWNELDPVDDWERQRNDKLQPMYQNRNPFVDNNDWVYYIWGDGPISKDPSISITSQINIEVNQSKNVGASIKNGTGTITYSSNNTAVATVDKNGLVTGHKVGSATITASATIEGKTYSGTCNVTVKAPVVLTGLTMNRKTADVDIDSTIQLSVTPTPSDAIADVTWKSSAANIATVTAEGLVKGIAEGTATITATSTKNAGITATCTVTVKKTVGYKKITKIDDLTSGKYIIGYQNQNQVTCLDINVSQGYDAKNIVSVENNVIKNAKSNCVVNIKKAQSGYSIENNGNYLAKKSGKDFKTTTTETFLTLKLTTNEFAIVDGNYKLQFNPNNGSPLFRYYDSAQEPLSIFKGAASLDPDPVDPNPGEGGGEVTPPGPVDPDPTPGEGGGEIVPPFDPTTGFPTSGNFKKVNGPMISYEGFYLIASGTNVFDPSMGDVNNNLFSATITENVINVTGDNSKAIVMIEKVVNQENPNDIKYAIKTQNNNSYIYSKGNNKNSLEYSTSKDNANYELSINNAGELIFGTTARVLRFNNDDVQHRFRFYGPTQQNAVNCYKLVDVAEFSRLFNDTVKCDNGVTKPSVQEWDSMKTIYNLLSDEDKTAIKTADRETYAGLKRYDYILAKYGESDYENFLGRTVQPISPSSSMFLMGTEIILIVSIVSITAITAICFVVISKKRKTNSR